MNDLFPSGTARQVIEKVTCKGCTYAWSVFGDFWREEAVVCFDNNKITDTCWSNAGVTEIASSNVQQACPSGWHTIDTKYKSSVDVRICLYKDSSAGHMRRTATYSIPWNHMSNDNHRKEFATVGGYVDAICKGQISDAKLEHLRFWLGMPDPTDGRNPLEEVYEYCKGDWFEGDYATTRRRRSQDKCSRRRRRDGDF